MRSFAHPTNAVLDKRIRKVIRTHGADGYGIWWALVEQVHLEDDKEFKIVADNLWLEGLAESLCISDHRALIRVIDTFAEVGLISAQLWAEHTIYLEATELRGDAYIRLPRKAWEKLRQEILARDNYTCQYCGVKAKDFHCDHVVPLNSGGSNDPSNLVTACSSCNLSKGSKSISEWGARS